MPMRFIGLAAGFCAFVAVAGLSSAADRPQAATKVTCTYKQVVDGVGYIHILGPSSNNCVYVVGSVRDALIIDAYWAKHAKQLIVALEAAGVRPDHVRAILVTHGHDDHYGGAGALAKWCRAPVWAHVCAAAQMEDPWGNFAAAGSPFPNTSTGDWEEFRARVGEPVRVDRILREGDVIEHAGMKLEVLHTPGHERGEITLYERSRRFVFTGDMLQGGMDPATGRCSAVAGWLGLFTDAASQRRSLRRVAELTPEWNFKGHGGPLSGPDVQTDLACALTRLDGIEQAVLEALGEKSPLGTTEVTRAVFRKLAHGEPKILRYYAVVSVTAVLLDLSRRGLVKRTSDLQWESVRR